MCRLLCLELQSAAFNLKRRPKTQTRKYGRERGRSSFEGYVKEVQQQAISEKDKPKKCTSKSLKTKSKYK